MKRGIRSSGFILLVGILLSAVCSQSAAAPAANFYKGKTIKLLIPFAPGGGFDTELRLFAPWLQKYTGAKVMLQNMPGGGATLSTSYVYEKAAPDGLTITGWMPYAMALMQLAGAPEVRWDANKLTYLGAFGSAKTIFVTGANAKLKTFAEQKAAGREIKMSHTGGLSGYYLHANLVLPRLGLDIKNISGYNSASEATLAAVRGEVDMYGSTDHLAIKQIKDGTVIGLYTMEKQKFAAIPQVPSIFEVANVTGEALQWWNFISDAMYYLRGFYTTPGVPKERVDFLRSAFDKAFTEKKFRDQLEKVGQNMVFGTGAELEVKVKSLFKLTPAQIATLKPLVTH